MPLTDLTVGIDNQIRHFQTGLGASCQGTSTGGPWTVAEQAKHINYLEMKAAFLALQSFCAGKTSISILLLMDNITAITFLNKMGGNHSHSLSDLVKEVWNWRIRRRITIHARIREHPGRLGEPPSYRLQRLELHGDVFLSLEDRLGPFLIDLFASRTNTQLPMYCSWRLHPAALAVDALSISWTGHHPYMFPLFTLIPHCLAKVHREKISAVIIVPVWPNQTWFPELLNSLVDTPILLPPIPEIVTNPTGLSIQEDYRKELWTSSREHGNHQQSQSIPMLGDSGAVGVLNGKQLQPV